MATSTSVTPSALTVRPTRAGSPGTGDQREKCSGGTMTGGTPVGTRGQRPATSCPRRKSSRRRWAQPRVPRSARHGRRRAPRRAASRGSATRRAAEPEGGVRRSSPPWKIERRHRGRGARRRGTGAHRRGPPRQSSISSANAVAASNGAKAFGRAPPPRGDRHPLDDRAAARRGPRAAASLHRPSSTAPPRTTGRLRSGERRRSPRGAQRRGIAVECRPHAGGDGARSQGVVGVVEQVGDADGLSMPRASVPGRVEDPPAQRPARSAAVSSQVGGGVVRDPAATRRAERAQRGGIARKPARPRIRVVRVHDGVEDQTVDAVRMARA